MLINRNLILKNEAPVKRRAKTKLAAVYCAGIISGSKNWLFNSLQEMWFWLKPVIVYHIEGFMKFKFMFNHLTV